MPNNTHLKLTVTALPATATESAKFNITVEHSADGQPPFSTFSKELTAAELPITTAQIFPVEIAASLPATITADGSVTIGAVANDARLMITSPALVSNTAALKLARLEIHADTVKLSNSITTDVTKLDVKRRIDNAANFTTQQLVIAPAEGTPADLAHKNLGCSFYNTGEILVTKQAKIKVGALINHNKIVGSQKMFVDTTKYLVNSANAELISAGECTLAVRSRRGSFINRGKILSQGKMFIDSAAPIKNYPNAVITSGAELLLTFLQLINSGAIYAVAKTELNCSSENNILVNTKEGTIDSDGEVEFRTLSSLKNFGKISGHTVVTLGVSGDLQNFPESSITSDLAAKITVMQDLINQAIITAGTELEMFAKNLINECEIKAENFDLTVANTLTNKAAIKAGKINAYVATLVQQHKATLHARLAKITAANKIENAGEMAATQDLLVKSNGTVANTGEGKMHAGRFLFLSAQEIANEGSLEAQQTLFCKAIIKFSQSPIARAVAQQKLTILSLGETSLAGTVHSDTDLLLEATTKLLASSGCNITSGTNLQLLAGEITTAATISSENVLLQAVGKFTQLAGGEVTADQLVLKANNAENAGKFDATTSLTLNITSSLNNLIGGLLQAATQLQITAQYAENAGDIKSFGTMQANIAGILRNLQQGKINSHSDLLLTAGLILENAGKINGDSKVTVEAANIFKQLADAELKGTQVTISAKQLDNFGNIHASNILHLKATEILQNYEHGTITAEQAITLIAGSLSNAGDLITETNLQARISGVIHNHQTGKIAAQKTLELLNATVIVNAGEIHSFASITAQASNSIANLADASITAEHTIKLLADFAITNQGAIQAEHAYLTAKKFLTLEAGGEIVTTKTATLNAEGILQDGILKTQKLTVESNWLVNSGTMQAHDLSVSCKEAIINLTAGNITATAMATIFTEQGFVNLGKLISTERLTIIAKDIHQTGTLSAEQQIYLKAINLMLGGDVQAAGDLLAIIDGNFSFETAALKADGQIELRLKNGYAITTPINSPGGLKFEIAAENGTVFNATDVKIGKDLIINAPGCVLINGIQFSKTKATLSAQGKVNTQTKALDNNGILFGNKEVEVITQGDQKSSEDSVTASNGNITKISNAGGMHENGKTYAGGNYTQQAAISVEHTGNSKTYVVGKAKIKAPKFTIKMATQVDKYGSTIHSRALSDRPEFNVGGDLELETNTEILAAAIHAGGVLKIKGKFEAHSFEEFEQWVEVIEHRGKRKYGVCGPRSGSVEYVTHHNTRAVWDSIVSAAKGIEGGNIANQTGVAGVRQNFHNEGSVVAPAITIDFEVLFNGNDINDKPQTEFATLVALDELFKENALFKRNEKHTGPEFAPAVPLEFKLELPPQVQLVEEKIAVPTKADLQQFHDIIIAQLVTKARQRQFRRGYLENISRTAEEELQTLYKNAYEFAISQNITGSAAAQTTGLVITKEQLKNATKPMILFKTKDSARGKELSPWLFTPESYRAEVAKMGSHATATIATTKGDLRLTGNKVTNGGKFQVQGEVAAEVKEFNLLARTATYQVPVEENKRRGIVYVNIERVIAETGQIYATRIDIKADLLHQLGGVLHSGIGGTTLEIKSKALIEALTTSYALQGEISKKGRNYAIVPEFIPAMQTSEGKHILMVTEGSLTACGIRIHAKELEVSARDGITSSPKVAQYDLPEFNDSRPLRKDIRGGTSFSACANVFSGTDGLALSSSAGDLQLANTTLISGGKTKLKGRKVEIKDQTAYSSSYSRKSGFSGFSYKDVERERHSSHCLPSTMLLAGDLAISADQLIQFKGVKGVINGDADLTAPIVRTEGGVKATETTTTSNSIGVSFFGSDAIEAVINDQEASKVLEELLQEDRFFAAATKLANAKNPAEKMKAAIKTLLEGYKMASFVSKACANTAKGDSMLGQLTDRWGLTNKPYTDANGKQVGRKFNPEFKIGTAHSTTHEFEQTNVATNLKINGNFTIQADEIHLIDGTKITAKNITLIATKLLEFAAARNIYTERSTSSGSSVSVGGDKIVGAGQTASRSRADGVSYIAAEIIAKETMLLSAPVASIHGASLIAHDVHATFDKLSITTPQDTFSQETERVGVNIGWSGTTPSVGVNVSGGFAESRQSNALSGIAADARMDLYTNKLDLAGAFLAAQTGSIKRRDGTGLVEFSYRNNSDFDRGASFDASINFGGNPGASVSHNSYNQAGHTLATISGLNIAELANSAGINTSLADLQYMGDRQEHGFWVGADRNMLRDFRDMVTPATNSSPPAGVVPLASPVSIPAAAAIPGVNSGMQIPGAQAANARVPYYPAADLEPPALVGEEVLDQIQNSNPIAQQTYITITPDLNNKSKHKNEHERNHNWFSEPTVDPRYDFASAKRQNIARAAAMQLSQSGVGTKQAKWKPLTGNTVVKPHIVRTETNSRGHTQYRDLNKGTYSKSATDLAKQNFKVGTTQVRSGAAMLLWTPTNAKYQPYDFVTRQNLIADPDIEYGLRGYSYANTSAIATITGPATVKVAAQAGFGVNIGSATKSNSIGTARIDLDGPSVHGGLEATVGLAKAYVAASASAKLLSLKEEFATRYICFDDLMCVRTTVAAEAAIGAGVEFQRGWSKYRVREGGSQTIGAGAGAGLIGAAKLTVDYATPEALAAKGGLQKPILIDPTPVTAAAAMAADVMSDYSLSYYQQIAARKYKP